MAKNIERKKLNIKTKRKQQVDSIAYLEKDPILWSIWDNEKDVMYDKI
ncbi:MAG: hypothetical protein NTV71_00865 [Candidatus Omnitrophica bacterium]|nr:hypothetical protein [Candidatus Omnitrophota bacterium]